jgi:hypothetical protein
MKSFHVVVGVLAMCLIAASPAPAFSTPLATHRTSDLDRQAIEALLASYTHCVTEHDEAGFRALLLDGEIPFASVQTAVTSNGSAGLRQYEDFRKAVFASGQRYRQRFYNVRIEQRGPLAQVSLVFVTERISAPPQSSTGWKVLQLVKVAGRWKIASELYTFEH